VNTLDAYTTVGRVDGLLIDYLTAVFDTLSQPVLARHVVRSLVMPGTPPVRLVSTVSDMGRTLHASETAIQTSLTELTARHVVQHRPDTTQESSDLVHDVLGEPALRATTNQEMGLSIIRPARAKRRWCLHRREYRAVKRSDLTELPKPQQLAARQLVRR